MSNWEPEEQLSDADMEGIAGGASKGMTDEEKKAMMKKKESASSDPFPSPDPVSKDPTKGDGKGK